MARQLVRRARCPGTMGRRVFLRTGLAGLCSLGLADLFRWESRAVGAGRPGTSDKSIIMLWLWGGPSHMETFDLKPGAPSEYRFEPRLRDGQRLDIYIEAPAAPVDDGKISVVIEVKCCWHSDLELAINRIDESHGRAEEIVVASLMKLRICAITADIVAVLHHNTLRILRVDVD